MPSKNYRETFEFLAWACLSIALFLAWKEPLKNPACFGLLFGII